MGKLNQFIKNNTWVALVTVSFMLVYLFSLTFVAVDGDHAASLTYHLLDRNADLLQPFFAYHGMMDVVLSIFPADLEVLTSASLIITAVTAILMVIVILILVYEWFKQLDISPKQKWLAALVILLASPEFFYFGLVYNPSLLSTIIIILSHLLIRRVVQQSKEQGGFTSALYIQLALSAILFGLGVSFRWNLGVYGAVIFFDVVILHMQLHRIHLRASELRGFITSALLNYIAWGVASVVLAFVAIWISGYDFAGIQQQFEVLFLENEGIGFRTFLDLLALTTPGFILLAGIGLVSLLVRRNPLIIVVLVGLAVIAGWFRAGVPKLLLPAIPGMILCVVLGFQVVWYGIQNARLQTLARVITLAILIVPWFVGFSFISETSSYGPWFELMPYDRDEIDDTQIAIRVGAGRAYRTPEAERPMFGHAFVLFGGWKDFMLEFNQQADEVVETALELDKPILSTRFPESFETNRLLSMGFMSEDFDSSFEDFHDTFIEHNFTHEDGREVTFFYFEIDEDVGSLEQIREIASLSNLYDDIIWRGKMQTLRDIYETMPEVLTPISYNLAILDLNALNQAINGSS